MKTLLKTAIVAFAAMLLVVGVVACGGGSSSSSSTSGSEESSGGGEEVTAQASEDEKLGVAAGKEAGAPVAKPKIKAGILNLGRVSESGARAEDVMVEALGKIGWSHDSCDSGGDPAKMASCGETLLNEGVEAIYLIAIPPEAIQPTLKRAKAEGVPVIDYAGGNPPSPYLAGAMKASKRNREKLPANTSSNSCKKWKARRKLRSSPPSSRSLRNARNRLKK